MAGEQTQDSWEQYATPGGVTQAAPAQKQGQGDEWDQYAVRPAKQPREKNAWGGWDPTAAMDPFTGEHGNPEKPGGFLNYAGNKLGELEDWATGKRDAAEEANLSNVARGGKAVEPGSLGDRASYYDAAARVARFGRGAISPIGVGATAATVAAPTIMGPVLLAHGGYNAVKHAPGALEGNPEEAEQSLGGLAEAAGGGAAARGAWVGARGRAQAALPEGETPTVRQTLAQTEPARAMRAADEVLSPITERLRVPEAPKALTQAIQPGVNIPRAQESIGIAGPRLQQLKQAGKILGEDGEPLAEFKSPADLLQGVKSAKAHVWDAIEDRLGPVGDLARADTSPVAEAMEKSVSKRTASQFPKTAEAIKTRAATYRDGMSLRDIENAIQDANNDLRNFYKRPGATDSPTGPDMAATEAEVKALRSLLDEKVADLRGSGVKDLKREYGALRDIEKAAARANAVATRQKGATLWEGLAALRAAGDFVSGNVLGAARGAGTLAVGRWLAKLRDPNFLIDKAFQGSKAFQPAGAIERPPIDVAQGEFAGQPPARTAAVPAVPRAGVQSATRALPSAERPQLPGRTLGQEAMVTPEPGGQPRLGTKLGEQTPAGVIPRRALPEAGGVNELPRRAGEPIVTGARRALPAANPVDLVPPSTPEHGIRTQGGYELSPSTGEIIGKAGPAKEVLREPAARTATPETPPVKAQRAAPAEEPIRSSEPEPRRANPPEEPRADSVEAALRRKLSDINDRISYTTNNKASMNLIRQHREIERKLDDLKSGAQKKTPALKAAPVESQYSADVIEEAGNELEYAAKLWDELPAPERIYTGESEGPDAPRLKPQYRKDAWIGIKSPRPSVEDMYPWVKKVPGGLAELKKAVANKKGAAYQRWLGAAAESVKEQRGRGSAGKGGGRMADMEPKASNAETETQSPEFQKWFTGSKVVDKNGKPLVVYHGGSEPISKVDIEKGAQGTFWVTSDRGAIERGESGATSNKHVTEMYLNIKNPAGWEEYDKLYLEQIKSQGYDGIILPEEGGEFNAIVFKPEQVKIKKPSRSESAGKGGGREPGED